MSEPIDLDLIEARAKALGWPTNRNPWLGVVRLRVTTDSDEPAGVSYYMRDGVAVRCQGYTACRHDLAALESPEPARPVVDPVTGLLPCPFCGGKAETGPFCSASLECGGCGLRVYGHSRPEVRAAWNRRTP